MNDKTITTELHIKDLDDSQIPRASRNRRKTGPKPIPDDKKALHGISFRLTTDQFAAIKQRCEETNSNPGTLAKRALLNQKVAAKIPEINIEKWRELAPLSANINQIIRAHNSGAFSELPASILIDVKTLVDALRNDLIGVKKDGE